MACLLLAWSVSSMLLLSSAGHALNHRSQLTVLKHIESARKHLPLVLKHICLTDLHFQASLDSISVCCLKDALHQWVVSMSTLFVGIAKQCLIYLIDDFIDNHAQPAVVLKQSSLRWFPYCIPQTKRNSSDCFRHCSIDQLIFWRYAKFSLAQHSCFAGSLQFPYNSARRTLRFPEHRAQRLLPTSKRLSLPCTRCVSVSS